METKDLKITSSGFIKLYKGLEDEVKKVVMDDVCRVCGISSPTFYYKNRTDSWKRLELAAIEGVLERGGICVDDAEWLSNLRGWQELHQWAVLPPAKKERAIWQR